MKRVNWNKVLLNMSMATSLFAVYTSWYAYAYVNAKMAEIVAIQVKNADIINRNVANQKAINERLVDDYIARHKAMTKK